MRSEPGVKAMSNPRTSLSPHETFQLHTIWNIPESLSSKLEVFKLKRITAAKLLQHITKHSVGSYILPHKSSPYFVTFHHTSYHTLCYDSKNPEIHYWISFRTSGTSRVAIICRDNTTIPHNWDSQRLQYWDSPTKFSLT